MNIRKIFLILIINLMVAGSVYAKIELPEEIRIGLYYGTSGASSVTLSSPEGIEIGTFDGDDFEIIDEKIFLFNK